MKSKFRLAVFGVVVALAACSSDPNPEPTPSDSSNNDPVQTPTVPGMPADVRATASFDTVTVTWRAPASDGGSPITRYKVTSSSSGESQSYGANELEARFTGLAVGTELTFTVVATNAIGDGPAATSNAVTTSARPAPPRNVEAIAGDRSVEVSWEAPANGEVTGYIVSTEPESTRAEVDADTFGATLTGLTNGTEYQVLVVAKTAAGNSNAARAAEPIVPFGVPGKVSDVVAVAVGDHVQVSWGVANANGRDLSGYELKYREVGETGWEASFSISATVQSTEVGTLSVKREYVFSVAAVNAAGTGEPTLSNTVRTFTRPGEPTGVVATTGDRSANVSWNHPADDGGSPLTAILVSTNPATSTLRLQPTATSTVFPNLTAGHFYNFVVEAENAAGRGPKGLSTQIVIDTDECARNLHDCSAAQACTNTVGSFTCETLLTDLTSSAGSFGFSPTTTSYVLPLSPLLSSVQLTPTAAAGATVTINGTVVASGTPSPVIAVGASGLTVTVRVTMGSTTVTYTIDGSRSGGIGYLKPPNPTSWDGYAQAIATAGDTVVIGAPYEDGSPYSRPGAYDDGWPNAGAVYVYTLSGTTPTLQAYLKVEKSDIDDNFGYSVALDGDTLAVGAPNEDGNASSTLASTNNNAADAGAVYVYTRSNGTWTLQAYLKAQNADADDRFGTSVAIDGDTLVVGAPSEDGNLNNSRNSGAAYVFVRNGTTWTQQGYLRASNASQNDAFGTSVAISGDHVIVGAPKEQGDASSTVTSPNDNYFSKPAGAAYIFRRFNGSDWSQDGYLKPPDAAENDQSGLSVAISGNTAVFSSHGQRAVQVYTTNGSAWTRQARLTSPTGATGDQFGRVAISGDRIIVGAHFEESPLPAGAAHLFERSGTTWTHTSRLTAPNPAAQMQFGNGLAISSTALVIGAPQESGDANSTLASPNTNVNGAGAAYMYRF